MMVIVLMACAAANVAIGRALGYTIAAAYLAFWAATLLTAGAAWRLARGLRGSRSLVDLLVSASVIAVAIVIGCAAAAAALGHFTVRDVLIAHAVVLAAALAWPARDTPDPPDVDTASLPPFVVAVGAVTLMFSVAFAVWHSPLTLYDSLSYHLYFAARWVQDHAIRIVPTPFSEEAQAYAPGNGELVFAWLMLPFHGDLLARMGQLPFALIGALAVFGLARRMGAAPSHAAYPAAFFLLSRPIAEQMVGANVDLFCAACFLAALYLLTSAADRDRVSDWVLAGVAAGLYCGSKYLSLVYVPVLVLLACARGVRRRAVWALPGIAIFAAPWYLRNWIVAGSPIYPSSLTVAGVTIARGAFTRAAMLNTVFHASDPRLLPAMAAHGLGPTLFVVWLPCAVAGWAVMARRGWWPHGAFAAVPLLMVPLYWFGLPVNIDSRFLMPAIGPALLPLAFIFTRDRRWNGGVHAFYAATMAWILVGTHRSLPGALPWYMAGWTALDGLISPPFVSWCAAGAVGVTALWWLVRRWPRLAVPTLAVTCACGTTVLAVGGERWCGGAPCDYLQTTSPVIRAGYVESWHWIDEHVHDATIAYTGINLPYPLTGPHLTNRVVYVNIDGPARWRFDDFDRAYRSGRMTVVPPVLATSSGELRPVAGGPGPRDDASRPRYERLRGNRDAWVFNLEALKVSYLFVASLSAYEIDYVWHDDRGFPIENEWARQEPARFRLAYQNPQVRLYEVTEPERPRP